MKDIYTILHDRHAPAEVIAFFRDADADPQNLTAAFHAGLYIVEHHDFAFYQTAIDYLERCVSQGKKTATAFEGLAYACWVLQQHEKSRTYSKMAISLNHKNAASYRSLTMSYLTQQDYANAFFVASAGMLYCPDNQTLTPWLKLATCLMKGLDEIRFRFDGIDYAFYLTTFCGQAMEASAFHLEKKICEAEELRYLKEIMPACTTIAEVGTLVGNHTVYFAKNFRPAKIIIFDADKRSIEHTTKNFDLNKQSGDFTTMLETHHNAVGNTNGNFEFDGQKTTMVTLDSALHEDVNFLKVDIDGGEIGLLNGAMNLIARCKPLIMIEVKHSNREEFLALLSKMNYVVSKEFDRASDCNYFVVPGEGQ